MRLHHQKLEKQSICFISPLGYPLLVKGGAGSGGAERQFFLFGRALAIKGWRVSFITNVPISQYRGKETVFPAFYADFSYLGGKKRQLPANWWSFLKAMKNADAYFYVVKVPGHLLPLMALFCRLYRRKLVFWAQTSLDAKPRKRALVRSLGFLQYVGIRFTDRVIAQSVEQQVGFKCNYDIKAHVVRSICDRIIPDGAITENQVDVLWAGNSNAVKRPEVVLELAILMPDVRFAMAMNVGNRSRFEETRTKAEDIPNLRFLGEVPAEEMESWFSRTRIFLNTSDREGFPNTFLQAWMNGVPVVSLQIDPDRLIQEKGLGSVVAGEELASATGNPKALARCLMPYIRTLLADENLRGSIGRRARLYVQAHHAPEVVVPLLMTTLLAPESGS